MRWNTNAVSEARKVRCNNAAMPIVHVCMRSSDAQQVRRKLKLLCIRAARTVFRAWTSSSVKIVPIVGRWSDTTKQPRRQIRVCQDHWSPPTDWNRWSVPLSPRPGRYGFRYFGIDRGVCQSLELERAELHAYAWTCEEEFLCAVGGKVSFQAFWCYICAGLVVVRVC
jgi:hypothetical protein